MSQHHLIIESLIKVAPIFQSAIPTDTSITIGNKDEILAYFPGEKIKLKLEPGMKIKPGTPADDVLKNGKPIRMVIPANLHGVEFTANLLPLKDEDGQVIGVLSLGIMHQNEEELLKISNEMTNSLELVNENVGNVSGGAQSLFSLTRDLLQSSEESSKQVEKTKEVITFIKQVADQTNLLGLNAAIEAARAGEYGRGFSVVANEIRKLSQHTRSSTETIQEILENIRKSMESINKMVQKISDVGDVQKDNIKQIHESVEEIQQMSKRLNEFANLI
ncbi:MULTISPECIES: methyl-accepting chemotaxis protein [unclassified Bacillus (in: firmicutes)]|uniref:methyl-accepting chemotaxis protein n=1 Tax=unclassified Bacillus (in: firmicutes) TaxID=185979 RepID=UPI0008E849B3|nr:MULTISPECIES: methyl-accepting chemotaxis protein [unclassified Bacillus (in: firmicutes)]SFA78091.1 Methyl-accepting chemotaxis protein (MCP) signalling domain-containing protein [Bacillus sp. UNCCL13]SFQ67999.1 Methyl-accepting chemotaxis protein (MCP) signalling domain-containing protein [Bacillus sp. cl95]